MRLTDLNPRWIGSGPHAEDVYEPEGSPARHGIGIAFDCPCGCRPDGEVSALSRCVIFFANPIDGGRAAHERGWQRTGDTFETLTLTPSILRTGGCEKRWHGFITAGAIITC